MAFEWKIDLCCCFTHYGAQQKCPNMSDQDGSTRRMLWFIQLAIDSDLSIFGVVNTLWTYFFFLYSKLNALIPFMVNDEKSKSDNTWIDFHIELSRINHLTDTFNSQSAKWDMKEFYKLACTGHWKREKKLLETW